jgi:Sec-independent protein secretion pathway component TatC
MALPLYMLYEISVWIAWYWQWRDRRREAAQNASPA